MTPQIGCCHRTSAFHGDQAVIGEVDDQLVEDRELLQVELGTKRRLISRSAAGLHPARW